jgi:hypothetical protein
MSGEWWAFIFLMVAMKAPLIYLGVVVWYACKPPLPPEEAVKVVAKPPPHDLWRPWRTSRAPAPRSRAARSPRAVRGEDVR